MKNEMITQIPAFNVGYFKVGQAVRVRDKVKNFTYDGLALSIEKDRIGMTRVEWVSPMCGSAGHEAKTNYIDIKDVVKGNFEIEKL